MTRKPALKPTIAKTGAPSAKKPRLGRGVNRHDALLDAAVRLLAERGYDGTSMRDIAEATGMLAGSIYYHYKSKDELLQAAYDRVATQYKEAIADPGVKDLDPWDRLEAACVAHLNAVLTMPSVGRLFTLFGESADPVAYGQVVQFREEHEKSFRKLIDELPEGDIRDPKFFRLALLGALNYVIVWYHPEGNKPAEIARNILAVFRPAAP